LNDSNKVDLLNFSQVFSTLEKSWVGNENEYPIMNQEDFFEKLANSKDTDSVVPIAILNMEINRLKPTAIESDALSFEDGVLNPIGEPYEYLETINWLFASPLSLQLEGRNQQFRLDRELYVQHQSKNIESIAIDFDDENGFIELTWDDVIAVDYEDIGEKEIVVRLTYEDCSFAYSQSIIEVTENSNSTSQRYVGIADEEFHIDAGRSYEGETAGGTVSIEYGCGNDQLRKPFIIIEGFNPPEYDVFNGNSDYEGFFNSLRFNMRNSLQNAGYDLIYLNYDNGAEPIQRNAYLVQTLLKIVNEMKADNGSVEPNVVLGSSMGGLVARYALAEMERPLDGRESEEHDTRLYISFDSPHRGANFPLGMQYMVDHISYMPQLEESVEEVKRIMRSGIIDPDEFDIDFENFTQDIGSKIFDRPATKQLLIQQIRENATHHNAFMEEYHQLGMPQNTRNIAIANGSQIGEGLPFDQNDRLFRLNYFGAINGILRAIRRIGEGVNPDIREMSGFQRLLDSFKIIGIVASNNYYSRFRVEPSNPTNNIEVIYRGSVFGNLLLIPIPLNIRTVKTRNQAPLDFAPGGSFNYGLDGIPEFIVDAGPGVFSHIPTVSALDIDIENNEDYFMDVRNANILGNNLTEFDNYAAPDADFLDANLEPTFNERHTTFTNFNEALFLEEVIRNNDFTPLDLSTTNFTFSGEPYYNFTEFTDNRIYSGFINNGESLLINNDVASAFPSSNISNPNVDSHIRVTASGVSNCNYRPTEITVEDSGEIIIGDGADFTGELYMLSGTSLRFNEGSRLVINEGSSLTMDCGSQFIFEEGAEIVNNSGNLFINTEIEYIGSGEFPYDYEVGNGVNIDTENINLTGPEYVCVGDEIEFRLNNWDLINDFTFESENGEDEFFTVVEQSSDLIRIRVEQGFSGSVNLIANLRLDEACGSTAKVTKEIISGAFLNQPVSVNYAFGDAVGGGIFVEEQLCPNTDYICLLTIEDENIINKLQEVDWTGTGATVGNINTNTELGQSIVYFTTSDDPENDLLTFRLGSICGDFSSINDIDYNTKYECNSGFRVSLSPNPTSSETEVVIEDYKTNESYEMSLLSNSGNLLSTQPIKNQKTKLDISRLKSGVYYIKVDGPNGVSTRKVLVN
tara:strand:+ start:90169 stop:93585 length:3417 start_codon:yes stop_codon:yes gene_type:complete